MKLKTRTGVLLGALFMALVMALAPLTALAADPQEADDSISVTGLQTADSAVYYQILQQNENTRLWEFTEDFENVELDGEVLTVDDILDGISIEEAGALAAAVQGKTGISMNIGSGKASHDVDPGTYLVIITPHDNNMIYAPVFVSADYKTDTPNTIDASTAKLGEGNTAIAKQSTVPLDKTVESVDTTDATAGDDSPTSVSVGSIIEFQVKTNVPSYTTNVKDPTFIVSDKVSTGLTITGDPLVITVGGVEIDEDYYEVAKTDSAWSVSFSEEYLTDVVRGNPEVVIVYKAEVTSGAPYSVNEMTNTAQVEFTHLPDGTTSYLVDQTNHYTYDFDMPLAGSTTGENSDEAIKVGIDSEGNPIITKETREIGEDTYGPLAGATFQLYDSANKLVATVVTDDDGHMSFTGLDAGTYTLIETAAPEGFQIVGDGRHTVVITPTYGTETINVEVQPGKTIPVEVEVVTSYTVKVDGKVTGTYTLENFGTNDFAAEKGEDDVPAIFENVRPTPALPTTGGAGTLALTVGGVALIAVGILVIMRVFRESEQA